LWSLSGFSGVAGTNHCWSNLTGAKMAPALLLFKACFKWLSPDWLSELLAFHRQFPGRRNSRNMFENAF
jgi:hypothetical protein